MASRRKRRSSADPFGHGEDVSLHEVDNALYGGIMQADRERVIRRPVSLDEVTLDPEIQVRVAGLDEDVVEQYAQILINGGEFKDPIVLYRHEEDDTLYLADGFHRCAAYEKAQAAEDRDELAPLKAEIHPGGRAGALEYAEEANLRHGKALSNADKREIFERRFRRGHEWARWSNRRLASTLGVDHKTIGNWRRVLTGGENSPRDSDMRVGADGKVYDVSGIQAANEQRERPSRPNHPINSDDQREKPSRPVPPRYAGGPEFDQRTGYEEDAIHLDEAEPHGQWDNTPSPDVPATPRLSWEQLQDGQPSDQQQAYGYAIQLRAKLEKGLLDMLDAMREIEEVRSIYSLATLDEEQLDDTDALLWRTLVKIGWTIDPDTNERAPGIIDHIEHLRARIIAIMQGEVEE